MSDFEALTKKAKTLIREKKYAIAGHATDAYPERGITAADILEVLKIGGIEGEGNPGEGKDRFIWVGEDTADRILRLVVVIKDNVIVVSAAVANKGQAKKYNQEDDPKG